MCICFVSSHVLILGFDARHSVHSNKHEYILMNIRRVLCIYLHGLPVCFCSCWRTLYQMRCAAIQEHR
jgi:hypothetical protein